MRRKGALRSVRYKGVRVRRRGKSWQVDYGMRGGKRVQRSFKTKELAKKDISGLMRRTREEAFLSSSGVR